MSGKAARRGPYVRPMTSWWKRDPYFVRYMWREATAIGVFVYAVVLTLGLIRLGQGEAAWSGWLTSLRSPWALLLHGVLLACMLLHAKSWFEIMPKTMPALHLGGQRVAATTITRTGWAAAVAATVLLLAAGWAWGR